MALQESFHCLLVAQLHVTLPYAKDCISVWKRTEYVRGRVPGTDTCCAVSEHHMHGHEAGSEIGDDSEEEEEEEEEDSEMDAVEGEGSSSVGESADAVTYMSIADLNRLRAGTDASQPIIRVKDQGPKESKNTPISAVGNGDRTDHVTYMSAAELRALRDSSSDKAGQSDGRKRSREGRQQGYSYGDDEEDEDEEEDEGEDEEEEDNGRSTGSKRPRSHADKAISGSERCGGLDGEGEEEGENELSAVRRLREEALDAQYEECDDKLWANIPKGTVLVPPPTASRSSRDFQPLIPFLLSCLCPCLCLFLFISSCADEVLPVDRAAPCLKHLLDFHPVGGRRVVTY